MAVVLGQADIYAHDGGMYQWDTAAPAVVAAAAGLHVSRIDGSPLVYNTADTWLPDFLVCRPELAGPVLKALWGDPAGRPQRLMELKSTRYEVEGRVATVWLHRPHRHNAWTGRMHAEYRWMMAELDADPHVRAVVVTGTPPAFCVGGDSVALAQHAERGGYDEGLPPAPARPGYGVRAELDHDFAWHYGLRLPVIAAVNGACAGVGLAPRTLLRPALRRRRGPDDDRRSQAGTARRVRHELGAPPARRGDPRRRPLAVGPGVHGTGDGVVGIVERRPADGEATLEAARAYAVDLAEQASPTLGDRDQAAALRRPAPPRRGGGGRGLEVVARLDDGCCRLPGRCRRAARGPPAALALTNGPVPSYTRAGCKRRGVR